MRDSAWKDVLNRNQHDNLPLLSGSLFAIMVLTTVRDFMLAQESQTTWMYFAEYLTLSLSLLIWVSAVVKLIPVRYSQLALTICILCIGFKTGLGVLIWSATGPGNLALTMFGAGLVLLSTPLVLLAQLATFAWWLFAAILIMEQRAIFSVAALGLVGGGLGIVVLRRRLAMLQEIVELRSRVENLESILPMCSGCKKTRDNEGKWVSVEEHIETNEEGTVISHGLCPDCKESMYGDQLRKEQLIAQNSSPNHPRQLS